MAALKNGVEGQSAAQLTELRGSPLARSGGAVFRGADGWPKRVGGPAAALY